MARFYYRRPPCPGYDFVGIEGWLERMAAKGMHLDGQGYVLGCFQFQKGSPAEVKFRLEANPKQSPLDLKPLEDPDPEAIALYGDFGWEYWGQYREFYIYRAENPNARELNTDPVVQAMGLDNVRKRAGFVLGLFVAMLAGILLGFVGIPKAALDRDSTERMLRYVLLAIFVLFGGAYLLGEQKQRKLSSLLSRGCVLSIYAGMVLSLYHMSNTMTPLLDILDRGWLWWIAFGGVYLSLLVASLISYVHICHLQKQLRRGQVPDRRKQPSLWRMVPEVLPFLMLLFLTLTPKFGGHPGEVVPGEVFSGTLPFPTLMDVAPEREYIPREEGSVRYWEDILSPVNYEWREEAWLDGGDGSRYGGILAVTYHEAANEAIAKRLVQEYSSRGQSAPNLIPDTLDTGNLDHLSVSKQIHPVMILRKGNIVIQAYCSVQSWGDHENLYSFWLEQMAAELSGKE